MSKVYGYCRTASAEGGQIEEQCAIIKDYCKRNDMKIAKLFCDEGMSAHDLNRTSLNSMINILHRGDVVVTKDISRLARDPKKQEYIINKMKDIGVEIVCVEKVNNNMLSIANWINQKLSK